MRRTKSRHTPLNQMLLAPDKWMNKAPGPKGILVRLWRRILHNLDVSPSQFNSHMNDFIAEVKRNDPDNPKTASLRGNLTKEFTKHRMTWPVFLKGLRFLKFRKIRFIVQVHSDNGLVVGHHLDVDLGASANLADFLSQVEEKDDGDDEQTEQSHDNWQVGQLPLFEQEEE